ncbi:MAG: H-X9-DG-CTERM domain-containing protein [Singulisphaera sp.]
MPDAISVSSSSGIVTARSLHTGGVNSLMADGSVRFVNETIGRKVWRALGTRNGDELVE